MIFFELLFSSFIEAELAEDYGGWSQLLNVVQQRCKHLEDLVMETMYEFFVGKNRFESKGRYLTGEQIKTIAKAPLQDALLLEGEGRDPDKLIANDQTVDLAYEHGGPKRFRVEPPANFGDNI